MPGGVAIGQEAVSAVVDDLPIGADRRRDHRQAAGHVLDQLVAALAALPWRIGERHHADVAAPQHLGLGALIPWQQFDIDTGHLKRSGADGHHTNAAFAGQLAQRGRDGGEVASRRRRADPADAQHAVRLAGCWIRCRIGVMIEVDHRRQHFDPACTGGARSLGEVVIAGGDEGCAGHQAVDLVAVERSHRGRTAQVVVVEDGVVEVDDERLARQQSALEPGRSPGPELLLQPPDATLARRCQRSRARGVATQDIDCNAFSGVLVLKVATVEQALTLDLPIRQQLRQWRAVLLEAHAGRRAGVVVAGQAMQLHRR